MPHPKRRQSKSRRDKRRTHYKAVIVAHTNCPECGALKLPHSACSECGYYNGRKILINVA